MRRVRIGIVAALAMAAALALGAPVGVRGRGGQATPVLPATPVVAAVATPVAVANGSACLVAPRSFESLLALTTPVAGGAPPPVTGGGLPAGEPLDAATLAAITATAREVVACENAGESLRALALYSDPFLRQFLGAPGFLTPERYAALATPRPVPEAERATLVEVRDGRRLADGRVGATVVVAEAADPAGGGSTDFLFFVEGDGRWLVDGVIEDVGAAPTPVG